MLEETEEDYDEIFRLSLENMSITAVDQGLEGLEIKHNPQNICEWISSCCCPCLSSSNRNAKKNKDKKKNDKKTNKPVSSVQMKEFTGKNSGGSSSPDASSGCLELELRSSFHFPSQGLNFDPSDLDFSEDPSSISVAAEEGNLNLNLNTDIAAWEGHLLAYEVAEESLLDMNSIPFDVIKKLRVDPAPFLASEDSAIAALAVARQELLNLCPDPADLSAAAGGKGGDRGLKRASSLKNTQYVRSAAAVTRFMGTSGSRSSSGKVGDEQGGRERSGTLNPLNPGGRDEEEGGEELEAVDEVVTTVRAGQEAGRRSSQTLDPLALSKRWAGRLSEMAPTQGKMVVSKQKQKQEGGMVDEDLGMVMKVRPKWYNSSCSSQSISVCSSGAD